MSLLVPRDSDFYHRFNIELDESFHQAHHVDLEAAQHVMERAFSAKNPYPLRSGDRSSAVLNEVSAS